MRPPRAFLRRSIVFLIVFLGRLATWRDHFGFIGGNMGLFFRHGGATPRITASNCTTLRSPEPELKGAAPMQIALMSTYEVLAQLLENITSPAYLIRHATVAIQSERNKSNESYCGIIHAISCQCCH